MTFAVRPLTGRIGAEVSGINLTGGLTSERARTILDALWRHRVLFFRGQHLNDRHHEALASALGQPFVHPILPPVEGSAHVIEFDGSRGGRANSWHTEMTFLPVFPSIGILRGELIPEIGGDTLWANSVAAYQRLPAPLRELAGKLSALHSNLFNYGGMQSSVTPEGLKRYQELYASKVYETQQPVVQIHPVTGEAALILGHFTRQIVGLNANDSTHVLAMLQEHVVQPENCVRWTWGQGDVAIWDNRATQHRAVDDFGDAPRIVRRVMLAGCEVRGLNGQETRAIRGPSLAEAN